MILIGGKKYVLTWNPDTVIRYRVFVRTGRMFLQEIWHGQNMSDSLERYFTNVELLLAKEHISQMC